jgi:hypothetical protein
MITVLGLIFLIGGLIALWRAGGWLIHRAGRIQSYPPQAAEAPDADGDFIAARAQPFTDESMEDLVRTCFPVPYVDSGHQRCGGPCCAEEQLDELVADFDWAGHEREFRRVA